MPEFARRSATALYVIGGIAIVFGLVFLVAPKASSVALVFMWGIYALADGIISLVLAFRPEGAPARGWLIVNAILGVIAGLWVLLNPIPGAIALAWVLGFWMLIRGIMEFVAAFSSGDVRPRWLIVLGAILWVIAGILFLVSPGAAVLTIALWLGILAIVWGVTLIAAGTQVHKAAREAESR